MEDQFSRETNPWVNLSTVQSFDKGTKSCSTRCIAPAPARTRKVSSSSILIGSLVNQLCCLLEKDPSQSKRLYLLLCDTMHRMKLIDYKAGAFQEMVQDRYIDAMCQLIKVARATIAGDAPFACITRQPSVSRYISLYQDQFHETGFIAVGGFGSVFKAVHKLDEVEYAIKKILVKPGKVKTIMNYLQEVKTLARLNHTNIVPYKQAWIEHASTPCMMQLPSCSASQSKISDKPKLSEHYTEHSNSESAHSDIVSFREDSQQHSLQVRDSSKSSSSSSLSRSSMAESTCSEDESCKKICQYSAQAKQYTILYIQMALCERTLRQWMDARTEPSSVLLVADICRQMLSGLEYIHSLKIVHHDIKPSNIFISTSDSNSTVQIQLGDFGLACPLQRDSHDAIVGTCMYAAPEQMQGECDPKSDIYSLGIVLLELLIPMQTSMECLDIVRTLQNGRISASLLGSDLKWVNIIRQLIQKNPKKRPCTSELLEELKMDKDLAISKLQNENLRLRQENDSLLRENQQKNELIESQKILIQKLQAAVEEKKEGKSSR